MLFYRAKNLLELAQFFEDLAERADEDAKSYKGTNRAHQLGTASGFRQAAQITRSTKFVRRSKKEA